MELDTRMWSSSNWKKAKSNCLGVVLSSGNYFDIGQDNKKVLLNAKALIAHMMGLISEVGINSICVSGNIENKKNITDYLTYNCTLGEIYSVLTHPKYSKFESALILPIDMPLLNENILEYLFFNIGNNQVVCYKENPFPLLIKIEPKIIKLIDFMLHNNYTKDKTLYHFLSKLTTKYLDLPIEYKNYFSNVNSKKSFLKFSKSLV